ncbi:MAG: caspase family protein [Methylocella sp.]
MAQFCRGQSRQVALLQILLAALSLVILPGFCAKAQNLYERPVLVVDPDMHTDVTRTAAVDATGRFLATGSDDKTVRIWSAPDGKLLRTIRMPVGPGHIGEVREVAMSPDGSVVAAGGFIQVQTRGEFGGLGIEVTQEDGLIKVVTPIDDKPASRAGILSGDMISAIDGENVQGLSLNQAVDKMRGAPGTSVTLKILRGSNKDSQDIKLARAAIPIPITSHVIYLFDRNTGKMTTRIGGLPDVVQGLAFSADGRYLAVVCHSGGLRVFDRDKNWTEAFRDATYGDQSYGVAFADDGRLATSSYDGKVRLYDRSFKLAATQEALSGRHPARLAFRPDGKVVAAGYEDNPSVDLLDGHSLARLPGPNIDGLDGGELMRVAWSADGQTLFASGRYKDATDNEPVLAWDQSGHGTRRAITAKCAETDNTTMALVSLPAGQLLVAKANPCFTMLKADGVVLWDHRPPGGDFRNQGKTFSVSADGTVIDFGFEVFGKVPLRFDLGALKLFDQRPADDRTRPPRQDGLKIEEWSGSFDPKLDGNPIELEPRELSQSFAIYPDAHRFVLGADWYLYAFDAEGKQLWKRAAPGSVWAVNIISDGRLVVAAYGDGTIRWHRMDDGRELLALQVLNDKKNWVAWTPEGFYGATPGAFGVLKWHVNRGNDAAAEAVPVSAIPRLKRPDALPLVLQELETARALGIADLAAARYDVQVATGAAVAPGARLHILAIGISDYGDKATSLRLKFAAKDANDVASALLATQGSEFNKKGGLYGDVKVQYLHDADADRAGIFRAFDSMKANMAKDEAGQDLAVILFSGHGAMIGDQFYLLPYGVDAGTPAGLEAAAISANEFHNKVAELAKHGRVLVLLDACHSGAATGDGSALASDAERLRLTIADSNVTVLTSSSTNEFSREDEKWNHGAFTKVLLDALGKDADEDHDGLISMSELTHYLATHVSGLTEGHQHPGVEQRFEGELFIAGQ